MVRICIVEICKCEYFPDCGLIFHRWLSSILRRSAPQTPVSGIAQRLKNVLLNQSRGIFGILVPAIVIGLKFDKDNVITFLNKFVCGVDCLKHKCLEQCWMAMVWFYLIHPVSVPMCGLFPIFFLPLCNVMRSQEACKAYFSDNMVLMILGGMVHQLWNNSGLDRRIALSMLSSGPASGFTNVKLLYKSSVAAFFLSIFSNKLLVTSYITQVVTAAVTSLETGSTQYSELRFVVNNVVQTSSSIGSIVILHGSIAVILAKMCYDEGTRLVNHAETFNYLQYSVVAIIAAIFLEISNLVAHFAYLKVKVKTPLSDASKSTLKDSFVKLKNELPPKVTKHEMLTLMFSVLFWATLFTRSAGSWDFGWAKSFGKGKVTDSCVCAGFLILLQILPKGAGFLKYITAKKKSDLPPPKPESSILFWRFVNKNTIYGYIFVLGVGAVLTRACRLTNMVQVIGENSGKFIVDMNFKMGMLLVVAVSVALPNIITSAAACAVLTPYVLSAVVLVKEGSWAGKYHFACLAVGLGTTLGYSIPFLHTPAYFCHHVGKVPIMKMITISFLSLVLSIASIWIVLVYIAPMVLPEKLEDFATALEEIKKKIAEAAGGGGATF